MMAAWLESNWVAKSATHSVDGWAELTAAQLDWNSADTRENAKVELLANLRAGKKDGETAESLACLTAVMSVSYLVENWAETTVSHWVGSLDWNSAVRLAVLLASRLAVLMVDWRVSRKVVMSGKQMVA